MQGLAWQFIAETVAIVSRTREVLCVKGRRIRELAAVVQKRAGSPTSSSCCSPSAWRTVPAVPWPSASPSAASCRAAWPFAAPATGMICKVLGTSKGVMADEFHRSLVTVGAVRERALDLEHCAECEARDAKRA